MRVIRKPCFLLLILPALAMGVPPPMSEAERDKQIDAALYHYYSGETQDAKRIAQILKERFPKDPFFHELMAAILWQELEKMVAAGQEKYKRVNPRTVKDVEYLMERFYGEIYDGLILTQPIPGQNFPDPRCMFLRGMLLIRRGGFVAKFESGIKSYAEADLVSAEGIQLVRKSMEIDPSLCSAKYILALSKYSLIKGVNESIFYNLTIRFRSRVFSVLGGTFNMNDVFAWIRESMNCNSPYYYTKDISIDKKFVYQNILINQAGRMDKEVLPVLEELNATFPNNKTIRDNLFLVRLHLTKRR